MYKSICRLMPALLFIFVSVSFSQLALASSASSMNSIEKQNEALARAFIASLGQKDMSKVADFLAEDFTFQNGMNPKRQYGAKTFTDWWYGMIKNATKLEPKIIRLDTIGDVVILETHNYYQDDEVQRTFKGSRFINIKNGKIREYQEYRLPKIK